MARATPRSFIFCASSPKPGNMMTSVRWAEASGATTVSEAIGSPESPMARQPPRPSAARPIKIRFMGVVPRFSFSHFGMFVTDIARMEDFYTRVLGFTVTNRVELFVDTPWYCHQPVRMPLDMKLSDAQLWAWAEAEVRKQPDFKPVEEWRAQLARKIR